MFRNGILTLQLDNNNKNPGINSCSNKSRVIVMGRHDKRTTITVTILIAVMTVCSPAWAEGEPLPDRFMLRLGGYQVRGADTIVRLKENNQPGGAYIDFNETLGGETSATVFR